MFYWATSIEKETLAQKEKSSPEEEKQYKFQFSATANLSIEKVQISAISAKQKPAQTCKKVSPIHKKCGGFAKDMEICE